jgi:hypothetical protein
MVRETCIVADGGNGRVRKRSLRRASSAPSPAAAGIAAIRLRTNVTLGKPSGLARSMPEANLYITDE